MLVIGRKKGEGVYIGRGIRLTILDVHEDGVVRIGIEAPRFIAISRDDFTYEEHLTIQGRRESTLSQARR